MYGTFLFLALVLGIHREAQAAVTLEKYNVDKSEISVSGISSGGAFAVQLHVAFSSVFKGVGSIAGVPYHCSGGQLGTALGACMSSPSGINVNSLVSYTRAKSSSGDIDNVSNLGSSRVYIFSGSLDSVVKPGVSHHMETYYKAFLNSTTQIKSVFDLKAEHTFPTLNYGAACTQLSSPYLGKCNYDAALDLLQHIHGHLRQPSGAVALSGQFIEFDQSEFIPIHRGKRLLFDSSLDTFARWMSLYTTMPSWTDLLPGSMYDWTKYFPTFDWTKYLPGFGGSGSSGGYPGLPGIGELPGMGDLPGMTGGSSHSLDTIGYAYIPSGCVGKETACKLHFAFHGCKMGRESLNDVFAKHAGYNEIAELNNIIMIYPQGKADMIGGNPNGCWDWWGYAGTHFDTKNGAQMKFTKNILDRITG